MQGNYVGSPAGFVFAGAQKKEGDSCVKAFRNATKHVKKHVEISLRVLYDLFDN